MMEGSIAPIPIDPRVTFSADVPRETFRRLGDSMRDVGVSAEQAGNALRQTGAALTAAVRFDSDGNATLIREEARGSKRDVSTPIEPILTRRKLSLD